MNYLIQAMRRVFRWGVAQDVLRPYLLRDKTTYCFMPAESERKRRATRHASRRTPLSCGNRPGTNRKRRPKRAPGDHYTSNTYRRAIHRAVELANRGRAKESLAAIKEAKPVILTFAAQPQRFDVLKTSIVHHIFNRGWPLPGVSCISLR